MHLTESWGLASGHRPHRCSAATCQSAPKNMPQRRSPAAVPSIVNPNPQSPIHHSTTVTLTPPRDRPSLLTHAGTIPLCFHRLSPWQSPECGSLGIVLSSLTGLSEESMLFLCDDDSPRDQTDRLEGAPLFRPPTGTASTFSFSSSSSTSTDSPGRPRRRPPRASPSLPPWPRLAN